MSADGPLGGLDGDDAGCAAAGDDVTVAGGEFLLLNGCPGSRGEVGDLVDGHQVDREPHVRGDLAHLVVEQPVGPFVDLVLEPAHGIDRVIDRRADEPFSASAPQSEFDPLAVDQDQAAVIARAQCAVRDGQLEGDGLAAAGLAADQDVPLGEGDVDAAAEFVGAQVNRVPDRQRRDRNGVSGLHRFHLLGVFVLFVVLLACGA